MVYQVLWIIGLCKEHHTPYTCAHTFTCINTHANTHTHTHTDTHTHTQTHRNLWHSSIVAALMLNLNVCTCVCLCVYPRACASLGGWLVLDPATSNTWTRMKESDVGWRDAEMEGSSERKVFGIRLIDERKSKLDREKGVWDNINWPKKLMMMMMMMRMIMMMKDSACNLPAVLGFPSVPT